MKHWVVDNSRIVMIDDDGTLFDCQGSVGNKSCFAVVSANIPTAAQFKKLQDTWNAYVPR